MPPPERARAPPNQCVFSSTTARRPWCAAASAAVIPAAPLPTTTMANCASSNWARSVVMAPSAVHTRTRYSSGRAAIRGVPLQTTRFRPMEAPVPQIWDIQADVVVVGFGAAGACAALEAAGAGSDVVVLDRFQGGGATALSGGVVYAGGGTPQQREAGVSDSPEAMFDYLSLEVGDAASPSTLLEFCQGSPAMLAWLERHGVPFEGSLCPDKTSYPTNRHYLYYSGSELSARAVAPSRRRRRGAPGPRSRHIGRPAVRPAGRGRARVRRPRAGTDHRAAAGHRCRRAGGRGRGPHAPPAARLGPRRAPR